MTFRKVLEVQASHSGHFDIPDELLEAYFTINGIAWWEYRTMPHRLREEILLLWHLKNMQQDYVDRKSKIGK